MCNERMRKQGDPKALAEMLTPYLTEALSKQQRIAEHPGGTVVTVIERPHRDIPVRKSTR